jgi:hypothetical protein
MDMFPYDFPFPRTAVDLQRMREHDRMRSLKRKKEGALAALREVEEQETKGRNKLQKRYR